MLAQIKPNLANMAEKLQANDVQRRQPVVVRCCLNISESLYIPYINSSEKPFGIGRLFFRNILKFELAYAIIDIWFVYANQNRRILVCGTEIRRCTDHGTDVRYDKGKCVMKYDNYSVDLILPDIYRHGSYIRIRRSSGCTVFLSKALSGACF